MSSGTEATRALHGGQRAIEQVLESVRDIDVAGVASDGYAFQVETLWRDVRAGGRVLEVPIAFSGRVCGVSRIARREVTQAAWSLLRLRRLGWRPPVAVPVPQRVEAHP